MFINLAMKENLPSSTRNETKDFIKRYKNTPLQQYRGGNTDSAFWRAMNDIPEGDVTDFLNSNNLGGGHYGRVMRPHSFFWFDDIKRGKTLDDTVVLMKTLTHDGSKVFPLTIEYDIKDFERDLRNRVLTPVDDEGVKKLATYIYDKVVKESEAPAEKDAEKPDNHNRYRQVPLEEEGKIHYSKVEQAVLEAISKKIFNI